MRCRLRGLMGGIIERRLRVIGCVSEVAVEGLQAACVFEGYGYRSSLCNMGILMASSTFHPIPVR